MSQRARRPFWIHQFAEYLMGIALISLIFQDPEPAVPAAVGIVIVLSAATVRGPLGAFAGLSRRTHRATDLAIMVLLVVAAVQPWFATSSTGRLALIIMLVPFASSWWFTDWDERSQRRARRRAAGSERSANIGRRAGRVAGGGWRAAKNQVRSRVDDHDGGPR